MRTIISVLLLLGTVGCAGNNHSSVSDSTSATPPPVLGLDLSGRWLAQEMDCFNNALTSVTSTSQFVVGGVYTDTLVIDGATFTDTVVINNQWTNCTTQESGEIQFLSPNVQASNQVVTSGCNQKLQIANNGNPTDFQLADYSLGTALGNIDGTYLVSGNDLWMPGYFGVGAQSSSCFIRYHKN